MEPLGRRSNPQIAHTVSISMLRLKNALIKIHIFMDVKEKGLITRAKNGGIFMDIKEIYEKKESLIGKEIEVSGWIRNHRKQKEFGFIDFSDGTCFKHLQIVYDNKLKEFEEILKIKNAKLNFLTLSKILSLSLKHNE